MPIRVADGFLAQVLAEQTRIWVNVRADPDRAGEALRRAAPELHAEVDHHTPGQAQAVVYTSDGAHLTIDPHVVPKDVLPRIPDIVAHHLTAVGVEDAVIGEPVAWGGPLFTARAEHTVRAVRVGLFAAAPLLDGAAADRWSKLARGWVNVGLPDRHQLWLAAGFTTAAVAAGDLPVVLEAARRRRHACFVLAGREPSRPAVEGYPPLDWSVEQIRADAAGRLGGRFRSAWVSFGSESGRARMVLSGGGPDARDEDIDELASELIAVADGVASGLAYAFVDISFEDSLVLGAPDLPVGSDDLVPDAYHYQVLGPLHLARLGGAPPGARPLAAGRVGLGVGEPSDWLLGPGDESDPVWGFLPRRRDPLVRKRGRRLLQPCLGRPRGPAPDRRPDEQPEADAALAGALSRAAHERAHAGLRRRAALHEAGHAVAAIANGIIVPGLRIVSTTSDPMVHRPAQERLRRWGLDEAPASVEEAERLVVTVLAGPFAEMALAPDQFDQRGRVPLRRWPGRPGGNDLVLAETVPPPPADADSVLVCCSGSADHHLAGQMVIAAGEAGACCDPLLPGPSSGRSFLDRVYEHLIRWRPAVEALADALVEDVTLDGVVVHAIVEPLLVMSHDQDRLGVTEERLPNWNMLGLGRVRSRPARRRERPPAPAAPLWDPPAWTSVAPLPTPRARLGVASVDGRIYAIGGEGPDGSRLDTVEVYDEGADRWEAVAPLPRPREGIAACAAPDGRIYVLTVVSGVDIDGAVDVYDPVADRWDKAPPVPASTMQGMTAAASGPDGLIYLFSAEYFVDVPSLPGRVQRYDPVAGQWTRLGSFPRARRGFAMAAGGDDRLYLVGGSGVFEVLATTEAYDPFEDLWHEAASLSSARVEHALVADADGCIYAMGGRAAPGQGATTLVERYDPWANRWSSIAPLPSPRLSHAAAAGAGTIYVVGGHDRASVLARVDALHVPGGG